MPWKTFAFSAGFFLPETPGFQAAFQQIQPFGMIQKQQR